MLTPILAVHFSGIGLLFFYFMIELILFFLFDIQYFSLVLIMVSAINTKVSFSEYQEQCKTANINFMATSFWMPS